MISQISLKTFKFEITDDNLQALAGHLQQMERDLPAEVGLIDTMPGARDILRNTMRYRR